MVVDYYLKVASFNEIIKHGTLIKIINVYFNNKFIIFKVNLLLLFFLVFIGAFIIKISLS